MRAGPRTHQLGVVAAMIPHHAVQHLHLHGHKSHDGPEIGARPRMIAPARSRGLELRARFASSVSCVEDTRAMYASTRGVHAPAVSWFALAVSWFVCSVRRILYAVRRIASTRDRILSPRARTPSIRRWIACPRCRFLCVVARALSISRREGDARRPVVFAGRGEGCARGHAHDVVRWDQAIGC